MKRLRIEPVSPDVWDAYVNGYPTSLLFHTSCWLDLLATVYRFRWERLGIWSGRELIGVLPLMRRRLGPFELAGSPLMQVIASTPFLGPLVHADDLSEMLECLEDVLAVERIAHVEIAFPGPCPALATATSLGYVTEECQSVVLPLAGRTVEQLWTGLTPACRRAVTKAERGGVVVTEAHDPAVLAEYYAMCEEVYRDAGRAPHLSREFYAAAWEALAPRGELKVLLAHAGGRLLAGAVFLLHRGLAYYLSGASHADGLELRPNNLLQWRFIEWAARQGYQAYDLGGVRVAGITRFKLSFGGQVQAYSRIYRVRSPWARAGRRAYAFLIPKWRQLQHAAGRSAYAGRM